jgi:hypothetical protein
MVARYDRGCLDVLIGDCVQQQLRHATRGALVNAMMNTAMIRGNCISLFRAQPFVPSSRNTLQHGQAISTQRLGR